MAGEGTPAVDASCVAELAAALHCSTDAGQALLGQALELRHRLPRLWAQVHRGVVPAWQARRVAARTIPLSRDAAEFVDAQVAAVVGRIGPTQLDRLITAAILRFMPEEAERQRLAAADGRRFDIHHDTTGHQHGLAEVTGWLDLPDALDLDAAVTDGAQALADAGCQASLDVRRSMAVGELARRQPALDLTTSSDSEPATPSEGAGAPVPRPRVPVTLYLHLPAESLASGTAPGWVGNTGTPVTAGQIRDWCGRPGTRITVRPVIDLNETVTVAGYEVPERIREHIALRDRTCVFPWCSRPAHPHPRRTHRADGEPAWSTDADHIVPFAAGGTTATDNLAPLCRRHHRLKTFAGWSYHVLGPGRYLWRSPHGHGYARGPDGTVEVRGGAPPAPRPRPAPQALLDPARQPVPTG
nr:HNH endonuclease signature motif containing protein [Auraticoccus cholistanensis]